MRLLSASIILLCLAAQARALPPVLQPPATVRDAIGFNIHFTTPRPGEMNLLAATGVGWVRMDIAWKKIETAKGVYDFSRFDRLLSDLEAKHIRPIFILDYGNRLYTGSDEMAPTDDASRAAFARWAAATVAHFKGHGIFWELYNEPNNKEFWKPKPNAKDYVKLAVEACNAIHRVAPNEIVIGPALALINKPYLAKAIDGGVLNVFSAISLHPYRQTAPETFGVGLAAVRKMIAAKSVSKFNVPIIASEWGYPTVWVNPKTQRDYLARAMLFDLSERLPLTIWYDWRHGGSVEGKPDIFGLVTAAANKSGGFKLASTPLYNTLATLTRVLGDTHFVKRIATKNPTDWILMFEGPSCRCYAAWTTAHTQRTVTLPISAGTYDWINLLGHDIGSHTVSHGEMKLLLSFAPIYITPVK